MAKKTLWLATAAAAVAMNVVGCASTPEECDPSQDPGFFGKIGCTVSGSYDKRIEQKEQQVADLKSEIAILNQMTRELNAQDALLKGTYAERIRVLDSLKSDLYQLQNNLARKQALNTELQDKIAQMEAQIAELESEAETSVAGQKQLSEKRAKIEKLKATLVALTGELQSESQY